MVSYDVTFQLDQMRPGLKPGMSATAEVVVKQAEGVNVPTSAISASTVTVVHKRQAGTPARRHGTGRQQLDDHPQRPERGRKGRAADCASTRAPPASPRRLASRTGGGLGGGSRRAGGLGGGGGAAFFRGGG